MRLNKIFKICENQQNERLSLVIKTICNLIDDIKNDAEYFFITERFTHIKYYILNGNMSYMNVKKRIPKLYILQLSRPYITNGIGIEYVKKVVDFFDRQINEIGITGHSIISTDNEKDFQIDFSYIEPHIEKIISKKDVYIGRDGRIDKDLSFLNSNNDAITNYMKQILSHGYNNKICTFDITFNTLREEVVKSVMVINVIRRTGIAKEQLDMLSLPDFFNYSTDENANFSQFIDAFCKGVSKMFSVDNDVKYELKDSSIFINFVFKPRNPILRDITINGIEI